MARKKLFLVLLFLVALSIVPMFAGQITKCSSDSVIVLDPLPGIHPETGPRSPVTVPISASYESLLTSIILYFTSNLGVIEVQVMNTTTGGYDSDFIDTQYLSAIIPIELGFGHYIIIFTLPSGQRYQGEFVV